jgi:hypothetical protein
MTSCTEPCISTPIPWFILEQLAVGDLSEAEAFEIKQHLSDCPACSETFEYISNDQVVLPPLPAPVPKPAAERHHWKPWQIATPLSVAAAALLLLFIMQLPTGQEKHAPHTIATKGGDLALSLVRLRSGAVCEDPDGFEEGDRFRLLITSPPEDRETPVEVVVYQGDDVFFPYPEGITVVSGNQQGIDGAFVLTGDMDAIVCVVAGDPLPSRGALVNTTPSMLPNNSVCRTLTSIEEAQ